MHIVLILGDGYLILKFFKLILMIGWARNRAVEEVIVLFRKEICPNDRKVRTEASLI